MISVSREGARCEEGYCVLREPQRLPGSLNGA